MFYKTTVNRDVISTSLMPVQSNKLDFKTLFRDVVTTEWLTQKYEWG